MANLSPPPLSLMWRKRKRRVYRSLFILELSSSTYAGAVSVCEGPECCPMALYLGLSDEAHENSAHQCCDLPWTIVGHESEDPAHGWLSVEVSVSDNVLKHVIFPPQTQHSSECTLEDRSLVCHHSLLHAHPHLHQLPIDLHHSLQPHCQCISYKVIFTVTIILCIPL